MKISLGEYINKHIIFFKFLIFLNQRKMTLKVIKWLIQGHTSLYSKQNLEHIVPISPEILPVIFFSLLIAFTLAFFCLFVLSELCSEKF